jgi:hypothetical protein
MARLFGLELDLDLERSRCVVRSVQRGSAAAASGVQAGWVLLSAELIDGSPLGLSVFFGPSSGVPAVVVCVFEEGVGRRRFRIRLTSLQSPSRGAHQSSSPASGRSPVGGGTQRAQAAPAARKRRSEREVPRRFSLSPSRQYSVQSLALRSVSESPTRRASILGAIAGLFRTPIQSIEPNSGEALVACRRAWRGWKAVSEDDTIIMRKEYPFSCVERFNALRGKIRQNLRSKAFRSWQHGARRRREHLLCSLRILRLVIRNSQTRALAGWVRVTEDCKKEHARSRMQNATSMQSSSYPTSGVKASPGPKRAAEVSSAGSWLFGLFSSKSSPTPKEADKRVVQANNLVRTPDLPAHVRAQWPDLDLSSYVVARNSMASAAEAIKEGDDSVAKGKLSASDTQAALARIREDLKQAEAVNKVLVSSRDRMKRLARHVGWIKTSHDRLIIADQTMARAFLEQSGWNPVRALSAFTCEYVGVACAKNSDRRLARRAYLSWCAVSLSERLQRVSVSQLLRLRLLRAKRTTLRKWQESAIQERAFSKMTTLIRLKARLFLQRTVLQLWRRAAQEHLITSDDSADQTKGSDGLARLAEMSGAGVAGRALLGERGVSAGLSAAATLGSLLMGKARFDNLVAKISPPRPAAPHEAGARHHARAATLSPRPAPDVMQDWGQSGWSMSPSRYPRSARALSEELLRPKSATASATAGPKTPKP